MNRFKSFVIFLMIILLILLVGCDSGWSVMGWEVK